MVNREGDDVKKMVVSWDSKQNKNSPNKRFDHNCLGERGRGGDPRLCGAHHPKLPNFFTSDHAAGVTGWVRKGVRDVVS